QTVRKLRDTSGAARFSGPMTEQSRKNRENRFSARPYRAMNRVFARSARYMEQQFLPEKAGGFERLSAGRLRPDVRPRCGDWVKSTRSRRSIGGDRPWWRTRYRLPRDTFSRCVGRLGHRDREHSRGRHGDGPESQKSGAVTEMIDDLPGCEPTERRPDADHRCDRALSEIVA